MTSQADRKQNQDSTRMLLQHAMLSRSFQQNADLNNQVVAHCHSRPCIAVEQLLRLQECCDGRDAPRQGVHCTLLASLLGLLNILQAILQRLDTTSETPELQNLLCWLWDHLNYTEPRQGRAADLLHPAYLPKRCAQARMPLEQILLKLLGIAVLLFFLPHDLACEKMLTKCRAASRFRGCTGPAMHFVTCSAFW